MTSRCAFLSFRFGTTDGVSIVARSWMRILADLGFEIVTVAGAGQVDRHVAGLGIGDSRPPDEAALRDALRDVDLVVVENLCTIPLNIPAALVAGKVLAGRPTIQHHHDPPWHRPRYAHVTQLPLDDPAWRHVTINRIAAEEMADHGFETTVIYNGFAPPVGGDRAGRREALGVADHELLLAHPVRAIERKNLPVAIAAAESLDATYWLLGPAEEGYDDTLADLLARARCRVLHQSCDVQADIYAAADAVLFPSIWEGFGNPPIEASLARRPVMVGHYPFAAELRSLGFRFGEPDDPGYLVRDDHRALDLNERLAGEHFSIAAVAAALRDLLERAGWLP